MICFGLEEIQVFSSSQFWGNCFSRHSSFFTCCMRGFLANVLEKHFCLLKNVSGDLSIQRGCLLWTKAHFNIYKIVRKPSIEHSTGLKTNACMVKRVLVQVCNIYILVSHWFVLPASKFSAFSSEACVRSCIPIICAWFVVSFSRVIPRTPTTSFTTWDTEADTWSETNVVGR